MMVVLSAHVLERAKERQIDVSIIEQVFANPERIVDDESGEPGQQVYQSVVRFAENDYLVRLFVDTYKQPPVIKSVYRTSKISKYHESKIRP